jgi:DMSO/TMAO reductase YedYZ molybdopterin-dependent catalytic subunit
MKTQNQALIPVTKRPMNAETPHAALLTELTPTELFYVRNHFDIPRTSRAGWRLEVNGAVGQPLSLSLEEIKELPGKELLVTLECAGNGRSSQQPPASGTPWDLGAVSQARFSGTSLSNLLGQLEIADDALEVLFSGADQGQVRNGQNVPYARSLPLQVALHPDTLLVWEMNGSELTPEHGYPLRLVVPDWYGMASVKWLQHISLLTEPFEGFFQREEYVYVGEVGLQDGAPVTHMRVRSLILSPAPGSVLAPGEIRITGITWSGAGQVEEVELSFDQGRSWEQADLHAPSSDYGVQRWSYDWQPATGGQYTLIARASDSMGNTQPLAPRWNKGGYGNNNAHQISLSVE